MITRQRLDTLLTVIIVLSLVLAAAFAFSIVIEEQPRGLPVPNFAATPISRSP